MVILQYLQKNHLIVLLIIPTIVGKPRFPLPPHPIGCEGGVRVSFPPHPVGCEGGLSVSLPPHPVGCEGV